MTSVTDAAGSLTRTYEERGYLANETRVNGSSSLITAYTYDGAGRVASMTYPDGTLVTYAHDAAGYVSTVAAQLPGAKTSTTLANLTHLPFGPQNAVNYGNGTAESWSYDSDYRAGSIIDSLSGTKLQALTYAYDNADNVKSITDALNPANTQTLGYDTLNRLTSAVSGTGGYPSTQTVTISDATAGAAIYYTSDGSAPTASSSKYTVPVTVSSSETLSAIALASGYANSAVGSAAYVIAQTAAAPTFSPVPGSFTSAQTVTITDTTPGAVVYYTTDGSVPSTGSTKYSGPITVSGTETINAIAVASGYTSSSIATAAYNISLPTAATPSFSVSPGTYNSAQTVSISDTTPGAAIYFTTDGTAPTAASTRYSGPLTVASTQVVKAFAIATGYATSPIASAAYTISTNACLNNVTTNPNGNITGVPSADGVYCLTFTYNNANRAASVTGGAMAATYVYDSSGQRFSKANGGTPPTVYSYGSGGTLIAENDNGVVTDYVYADGRPVAILQPTASPIANQINSVVADRLGTPQVVTNENGSVVWSTTYQPFGTTGLVNASINQNLRFPGQISDTETGFSYNLNRDYMPNIGRYLETDPIGLEGGMNSYQYGLSNPARFVDPAGLDNLSGTYRISNPSGTQASNDASGTGGANNPSGQNVQPNAWPEWAMSTYRDLSVGPTVGANAQVVSKTIDNATFASKIGIEGLQSAAEDLTKGAFEVYGNSALRDLVEFVDIPPFISIPLALGTCAKESQLTSYPVPVMPPGFSPLSRWGWSH